MSMQTVYFYPHASFRDRQLDTIRRWPKAEVINPEIVEGRKGAQVSASKAIAPKRGQSWKQKLPLLNIKLRPKGIPKDAVVYVWGALMATGEFIVDLDNPWSLVGYNLRAMPLYRLLIKRALLSGRCREIRCMSEACRQSLRVLFGDAVYAKAQVHYPCISPEVTSVEVTSGEECRFLFVGTQFEIKGGPAMLRAFRRAYQKNSNAVLDVITHLPVHFTDLAASCPGIRVFPAKFSREEILENFIKKSDVLIHPSYMESFGMVILEAISNGLAVITTEMYATPEMVEDGVNGFVLSPPISSWKGFMPTSHFLVPDMLCALKELEASIFESQLESVIALLASNLQLRIRMRQASLQRFNDHFSRGLN